MTSVRGKLARVDALPEDGWGFYEECRKEGMQELSESCIPDLWVHNVFRLKSEI